MDGQFLHPAIKVVCALAALLATAPCAADGGAGGEPELPAGIERIREHDSRTELRRVGLLGLRLSYPQKLAGSLGVIWARLPADFDCSAVCDFRGPFVQLEPGLAGAQFGAGYGVLVGERGRNRFYLRRVYVGLAVKATLLRTWGDAAVEPVRQTFGGVELSASVAQVNFRLGLLRSLSDADVRERWLVAGGIGWGF